MHKIQMNLGNLGTNLPIDKQRVYFCYDKAVPLVVLSPVSASWAFRLKPSLLHTNNN